MINVKIEHETLVNDYDRVDSELDALKGRRRPYQLLLLFLKPKIRSLITSRLIPGLILGR